MLGGPLGLKGHGGHVTSKTQQALSNVTRACLEGTKETKMHRTEAFAMGSVWRWSWQVVMAGLLSLSVGVGHGQGVVGNLSY